MQQEFILRSDLIKKIKIPDSDNACLIVQPTKDGLGFSFNSFGIGLPGRDIEKSRFDKTVFQANKIVGQIWRQKKVLQESDPFQRQKQVFVLCNYCQKIANIAALILFASVICFSIIAYLETEKYDLIFSLALIFFGISLIIFLTIVIHSILKAPIQFNFEKQLQIALKNYLKKENLEYYNKHSCAWNIGYKCFWLELHGNINHRL